MGGEQSKEKRLRVAGSKTALGNGRSESLTDFQKQHSNLVEPSTESLRSREHCLRPPNNSVTDSGVSRAEASSHKDSFDLTEFLNRHSKLLEPSDDERGSHSSIDLTTDTVGNSRYTRGWKDVSQQGALMVDGGSSKHSNLDFTFDLVHKEQPTSEKSVLYHAESENHMQRSKLPSDQENLQCVTTIGYEEHSKPNQLTSTFQECSEEATSPKSENPSSNRKPGSKRRKRLAHKKSKYKSFVSHDRQRSAQFKTVTRHDFRISEIPDQDYDLYKENDTPDESEISEGERDAEEMLQYFSDETCEDSSENEEDGIERRKKKSIKVVREVATNSTEARKIPSVRHLKKQRQAAFDKSNIEFRELHKKKLNLEHNLHSLQRKSQKRCGLSRTEWLKMRSLTDELVVVKGKLDNCEKLRKDFEFYTDAYFKTLEKVLVEGDIEDAWKMALNLRMEYNFLEKSFPIYLVKKQIIKELQTNQVVVVVADTGSGKSTLLTQFLMQAGFGDREIIACTEPRKVAATSLANHISSEIRSKVGRQVGFHVGFHRRYTKQTKVVYTTNYTLLKECVKDPLLNAYSCVIVDEAHERSIGADLLLGMLKNCIINRSDLRIVITSATIDPGVFTKYFVGCPVIKAGGRTFPVDIIWKDDQTEPDPTSNYVDESVDLALMLHKTKPPGDILVFLTAPFEIEDAVMKLEKEDEKQELQLAQLHGKLQYEDQAKVFEPTPEGKRKVVFATVVGETSITIPGVKYVIDCGLCKESIYDPKRNINRVEVHCVSKSSADQRKGRAGRVSAGECYRLYSKDAYDNMRDGSLPEILRVHLGHALLRLLELGVHDPLMFDFVESPSTEALEAAMKELTRLDAVYKTPEGYQLSVLGQHLAKLPVEPALGKLVLLCIDEGIGYDGILFAAINTNPGSVFYRAGTDEEKAQADSLKLRFCLPEGDTLTGMKVYKEWLQIEVKKREWCLKNSIHSKAMRSITNTMKDIIKILKQDIGTEVTESFSSLSARDLSRKLQPLLLQCYPQNLSVFTGHFKLGYMILDCPDQFPMIHGSSALKSLGNLTPKYLLHRQIITTWRDYMVDIMPIDEDIVRKAKEDGVIDYDLDNLPIIEQCAELGPYGSKIIRRKLHREILQKWENVIKQQIQCKFVLIDSDPDVGQVLFFLPREYCEQIEEFVEEIKQALDLERQKMRNVLAYYPLEKANDVSVVRVALTAGFEAFEILNPGEYVELLANGVKVGVSEASVKSSFREYGDLLKTYVIERSYGKRVVAVFRRTETASICEESINKDRRSRFDEPIYRVDPLYQSDTFQQTKTFDIFIDLSGPLKSEPQEQDASCPQHKGFGFIKCLLAEDVTKVINAFEGEQGIELQKLARKGAKLRLDTAKKSNRDVFLGNIDESLSPEEVVTSVISELEKLQVKVKDVNIIKLRKSTKHQAQHHVFMDDFKQVVKSLNTNGVCGKVSQPVADNSGKWVSRMSFSDPEINETAFFKKLEKLDKSALPHGTSVQTWVTSEIPCSNIIVRAIKVPILILESTLQEMLSSLVKISINKGEEPEQKVIEICTESFKQNMTARFQIKDLMQGETLELDDQKAALCLFTPAGLDFLKKLMAEANVTITPKPSSMSVTLHGTQESRSAAIDKINNRMVELEKTENIGLFEKDIKTPGLIRDLVKTFGFTLEKLEEKTGVLKILLDIRNLELTVYGTKERFEKMSELIDEIAESLKGNQSQLEDEKVCPVCLGLVETTTYRLQYCTHTYCETCIKTQLKNDMTRPLCCFQEGCGEPIVFEDISTFVSLGSNVAIGLVAESVKQLMATQSERFFYCPFPDCKMIFKVGPDRRRLCPICCNYICLTCKSVSHDGERCKKVKKESEESDLEVAEVSKDDEKIEPSLSTSDTDSLLGSETGRSRGRRTKSPLEKRTERSFGLGGMRWSRGRGAGRSRGRGAESSRGRGAESSRGRGAETWRGRGAETWRGRGAETWRGRGAERWRGRGADRTSPSQRTSSTNVNAGHVAVGPFNNTGAQRHMGDRSRRPRRGLPRRAGVAARSNVY